MLVRTILPRLKKSWWFAWIVALILGLSQLNDAVDGLDKLLVLAKVKPDALALAQSAEKGEFSRTVTEAAWWRLFWARAFQARLERGAQQSEIDEAWRSYIAASEEWSTQIMVFIVTTEKFYGQDKSNELEGNVQFALNDMANSLSELRYIKIKDDALQKSALEKTDRANQILYKFVRGFEQRTR